MWTIEHNSLTPNSRNWEALESYEHESPETQLYTMIIVCKNAWNAYEAGMMWSSKDRVKKQTMAWSNKQSLQGSDHNAHHTWNEHLDMQANKINTNHVHAQYSTNAQYTKYMHLGTILQGHKSDST